MKKLLLFWILAVMGITAFSADRKIYCTTYPVWLLTKEITAGVPNTLTELIIPAGTGCPHEYVLTPADMRRLGVKNCIIVRNGLGLDDFFLRPVAKMNPDAVVITACRKEQAMKAENEDHHGHHHHHEEELEYNPHLFASPDTAIFMIHEINEGLCKADPKNAKLYQINYARFKKELQKLTHEMIMLKKQIQGKSVGVQHNVFAYLCRALDLHVEAEIKGENAVPSAAEMRHLVQTIRKHKIQVIYTEPQYPAKTAETLAKECGIKVCELDPLASGPNNPGTGYYIKIMQRNLQKIRSSLIK